MAEYKEVCQLIKKNQDQFSEGFYDWLSIYNARIFDHFEHMAGQAYAKGRRRYSARRILEDMRYETPLAEIGSSGWKLNNDHTPDFARLYLLLHPEQEGFFELRGRKAA